MRNYATVLLAGSAVLFAQPLLAADPYIPEYHPPVVYPEVDHGLKGSFYLRGSAAGNALWAREGNHPDTTPPLTFDIDEFGYGYSFGVGAGYETGDGWRADITIDRLVNSGMQAEIEGAAELIDGDYTLDLRSTIALANVYYDFGLGGDGLSAAGGAFAYVGGGIGVAYNDYIYSNGPAGSGEDTPGSNVSLAAAAMVGAGYDFGSVVADLGYRALYINQIQNTSTLYEYSIEDAIAHEVRGTVRYRF